MDALAASLERSPELFPQAWDPAKDAVRLIRLSETDYARASFLDDRILTQQTVGRTLPWAQLQMAVAASRLQENCNFIFHIGHVGSTLLSRLLGLHAQVFALREPAILRTLAQLSEQGDGRSIGTHVRERLGTFLRLWSRTFRPEQRTCIKATSFVSELAAQVLSRPSMPRAIFMFVPVETYLATILGGPNSRKEARMLAESRLRRLHSRLGSERWKLASLSEGEIIAMGWACEMSTLAAATEVAVDRVLWLNFDHLLTETSASLASAFRHLGIAATPTEIDSILAAPELCRYSKGPEHPYDAQLRRDVLHQARREHRSEILRGLAWLAAAACDFPTLKDATPVAYL